MKKNQLKRSINGEMNLNADLKGVVLELRKEIQELKNFMQQEFRDIKNLITKHNLSLPENYFDDADVANCKKNAEDWFPINSKEELKELDKVIEIKRPLFVDFIRKLFSHGGIKKNFHQILGFDFATQLNYQAVKGKESLSSYKNVTEVLLVALQETMSRDEAINEVRSAFRRCKAKDYNRKSIQRRKTLMYDTFAEFEASQIKQNDEKAFNDLIEELSKANGINDEMKTETSTIDNENLLHIKLDKNSSPKKRKSDHFKILSKFPINSEKEMLVLDEAIQNNSERIVKEIKNIIDSNGITENFNNLFGEDIVCAFKNLEKFQNVNNALFNALKTENDNYSYEDYSNDIRRCFKKSKKRVKRTKLNSENDDNVNESIVY